MGKPRGPAHRWFHRRWATRLVGCLIAAALVCLLSACGGGGGSEGEGESFPPASDEEGLPPVDADAVDPMPSSTDDDGPPAGSADVADRLPPSSDDDGLPPVRADAVDPTEVASGGGNTVALSNRKAFSKSNPQISFLDEGKFKSGDLEFRGEHDGLGPLFNNDTCQGCHHEDGRGNLPADRDGDGETDQPMVSMLVRVSIPGSDRELGVVPEPTYGGQIQVLGALELSDGTPIDVTAEFERGLSGKAEDAVGEAFVSVLYEPLHGQYHDGTPYTLSRPVYRIRDLAYGPFHDDILFSPRVASQVVGMGLLDAIPEADLLMYADPEDADGDGISGRPNRAWDILTESTQLGRFGHKATKPTLLHQLAAAYLGDIGITSSLFPFEDCTALQPACQARAEQEMHVGEVVDLDDLILALVEFYVRQLAVPARRGWNASEQQWDPKIWQGRRLFFEAGCVNCHVPRYVTGDAIGSSLRQIAVTLDELSQPAEPLPTLSQQVIWPFTDLLLHDMGGSCSVSREIVTAEEDDGRACQDDELNTEFCLWVLDCDGLADGRPDFQASGSEWRTAPLWGLGLVQTVNPAAGFLHDGRAETIEEAILWHGHEDSEARGAWEFFVGLSSAQRADLLAFLESL